MSHHRNDFFFFQLQGLCGRFGNPDLDLRRKDDDMVAKGKDVADSFRSGDCLVSNIPAEPEIDVRCPSLWPTDFLFSSLPTCLFRTLAGNCVTPFSVTKNSRLAILVTDMICCSTRLPVNVSL